MSSDYESSDDEAPILLNLGSSGLPFTLNESECKDETKGTSQEQALPVVPVTILTGFLGSGKTTLIQYILRSEEHGKKIAIIENEFSGASAAIGAQSDAEREGLSIETMIARDGTNNANLTDLIELPNGCICCTVKDSLVETLEALLSKKRELDYIIIECSGMANPGPIASIFWLDDALESRLRLDGIVACVDARNLEMQLSETTSAAHRNLLLKGDGDDSNSDTSQEIGLGGDEAAQQIAFADRIIINKVDLLEGTGEGQKERKIQQVVQQVRAINATAPYLTTTFSQVADLEWVLDANCFDIERAKDVEASFDALDGGSIGQKKKCLELNCVSCTKPFNDLGQDLYCSPCSPPPVFNHTHTNTITTVALIEKGSANLKATNTWLASILWPDQDKEDNVLKAQLEELEKLNEITTPEMVEKRRKDELRNKMNIFRIKGILSIQHDDGDINDESQFICEKNLDARRHIVQAVNDLWEINPANNSECWTPKEERICKLVIIGRNLKSAQLLSGFRSCLSDKR